MAKDSAGKGDESKVSITKIQTLREWAPWILAAGAFLAALRELPVEQQALAQGLESHKISAALVHDKHRDDISELGTKVTVLENDRTWIKQSLERIEKALPSSRGSGRRNGRRSPERDGQ